MVAQQLSPWPFTSEEGNHRLERETIVFIQQILADLKLADISSISNQLVFASYTCYTLIWE